MLSAKSVDKQHEQTYKIQKNLIWHLYSIDCHMGQIYEFVYKLYNTWRYRRGDVK